MFSYFKDMLRPVSIERATQAGEYVGGEWQAAATQTQEDRMVAIPLTPGQLRNMPWGVYTSGDMKFYGEGRPKYEKGDIITFEGIKYVIRDITDRAFEGNFSIYMGKRQEK